MKLFCPAALALLAVGCKAVIERVFTPPAVRLENVRVERIDAGGGSLGVVLRVANRNPYQLTARHARYRLLVRDSVELGRGEADTTFTVAARDSATVSLPLDVSWRGIRAAAGEALADGTVPYRIVGEIVAGTPIGTHTFPVDARGRFAAVR